ncbi:hypothetical protein, partial [Boudabousia marimammalium]
TPKKTPSIHHQSQPKNRIIKNKEINKKSKNNKNKTTQPKKAMQSHQDIKEKIDTLSSYQTTPPQPKFPANKPKTSEEDLFPSLSATRIKLRAFTKAMQFEKLLPASHADTDG